MAILLMHREQYSEPSFSTTEQRQDSVCQSEQDFRSNGLEDRIQVFGGRGKHGYTFWLMRIKVCAARVVGNLFQEIPVKSVSQSDRITGCRMVTIRAAQTLILIN